MMADTDDYKPLKKRETASFNSPLPSENGGKRKYYIHDTTRGFVGNSMVWWARDHRGYTCDIREAHVFDEDELHKYLEADDLVAYPVEHVNHRVQHHVTHVDRAAGLKNALKRITA